MNILAIDTTAELASLAVRSNRQLVYEAGISSPDGHAHVIFAAIRDALAGASLDLNQIDCFACANGPGSFTGVRVGLSAVKGLAEALSRPAAGISNLRAMAVFGNGERRAVVLDARRGQVFASVYDRQLECLEAEAVLTFDAWIEQLSGDYEFITSAGSMFGDLLATSRFSAAKRIEVPRQLAAAIAFCAELDGERGRWTDPATLDANYVRQSDAELLWRQG